MKGKLKKHKQLPALAQNEDPDMPAGPNSQRSTEQLMKVYKKKNKLDDITLASSSKKKGHKNGER